jgi:chemotaxis signal transduction protein
MPLTAAETLRQEFDESFALPFRETDSDTEDLLAIVVGHRPYALRVAELGGVAAGRRVTRVPSADSTLWGLIGVRTLPVPLYDLARLLGEEAPLEPPRWVALSAGPEPVGLAFGALEGHLRLPRPALEMAGRGLVACVIREAGSLRSVVDVPGAVRALRQASERPAASGKEP